MKCIIQILVISFLLSSCYKVEKPAKPKNLISEQDMVHILLDMSFLSSAKGVNKKHMEKEGVDVFNYVYKKHHIDSLQFAKSNAYYTYDIEKIEGIYERVQDSLKRLKAHLKALDEAEKKRKELKKGEKGKQEAKIEKVPKK